MSFWGGMDRLRHLKERGKMASLRFLTYTSVQTPAAVHFTLGAFDFMQHRRRRQPGCRCCRRLQRCMKSNAPIHTCRHHFLLCPPQHSAWPSVGLHPSHTKTHIYTGVYTHTHTYSPILAPLWGFKWLKHQPSCPITRRECTRSQPITVHTHN